MKGSVSVMGFKIGFTAESYDEKTAGKHYADEFKSSHYFADVDKCTLFHFAVDNRETGAFTL